VKVKAFSRVRTKAGMASAPQILVRERSAYVAEIRSACGTTCHHAAGFNPSVSGVFYAVFAAAAVASDGDLAPSLLPRRAGRRAPDFWRAQHGDRRLCAILIGLGVDFAILVFGRYHRRAMTRRIIRPQWERPCKDSASDLLRRAHHCVGFLALMLAGSRGLRNSAS